MKSNTLLKHSLQISTPNSFLCAEFYIRELQLALSRVKSGSLIEPSALIPLYNHYAQIFDKIVMNFLHQDIIEYKKAKNIKTSGMSQKNALETFAKYRQSYNSKGFWCFYKAQDNFYATILKKYPVMQIMIHEICENLVTNLNRMLFRIAQDQEVLKIHFLQNMTNPKLSKIISTGNDFHKHG